MALRAAAPAAERPPRRPAPEVPYGGPFALLGNLRQEAQAVVRGSLKSREPAAHQRGERAA
eukprot:2696428-Prymnesium_polylepis.1